MKLNYNILNNIAEIYGEAFYIIDLERFKSNFLELKNCFSNIYPDFNIAYSYKTNYIPSFCKVVDELGGFAEVVSDMELELALKIGVLPSKIIWNGPYKDKEKVQEFLLSGGIVNIDSIYEIEFIKEIIKKYPKAKINLGIRCNFDIGDEIISRFGFDVETEEFKAVLNFVKDEENINFVGIQCHFATRILSTWKPRAEKMLKLIEEYKLSPTYIDLGGGIFGKMHDSLKRQFSTFIPDYIDYANEIAYLFKDKYKNAKEKPMLLIEPGTALVGDCMKFCSKVINIKKIRGKNIATLLGSIYNINPTLNQKNPPISIYSNNDEKELFQSIDLGGFTCIESDYLYRNYSGKLGQDDFVVFDNVGSYSIVLKPPFILPNFPVLLLFDNGQVEVIKRKENFEDVFHTYKF